MSWIADATGHRHLAEAKRERLISLVPSTTETLFEIGAGERVRGITRFCVRPARARGVARTVGGTKTPDVETILRMAPDLVFANQEENREEDVVRLRAHAPVYVGFPRDVPSAIGDIRAAGRLVGCGARAADIASRLAAGLEEVRAAARSFRYLYFIWRRPYMVAGPSTFIEALLAEGGGTNAAPRERGRYPEMTPGEIAHSRADVLLLSSEPFPFEGKHAAELDEELANEGRARGGTHLVDGQLLSWHGTRLLEGLPYLRRLAKRLSS